MENSELMIKAQNVCDTICSMLDSKNYTYECELDSFEVNTGVKGKDIPMPIRFVVQPERQMVSVYSPLPFEIKEDKRIDIAMCLTVVNNHLVDGSFDCDLNRGRIAYRATACYIESEIGEGLFEYMLSMVATTVDEYNDKLFMVSQGVMDFEQFVDILFED